MRTGFIGLGSQGGPMARRIAAAGFPLALWARRPETTAAFGDTGAAVAATPRELAAASDLVCLCVVGDADVRQVLGGPDGVRAGPAPGAVVAVHSTVHPDSCREIAATAATTFALAAELGVDPARLGGVLGGGTANSFALAAITGSGGTVEVIAAHAGALLRKDVRLLRDLADRAGAQPAAVATAAEAALALMRTG